MRTCSGCGRTYQPVNTQQRFCTSGCRERKLGPRRRVQRGDTYGSAHRRERQRWRPLVDNGEVACARCGRLIVPGTPWHLDHDEDRSGYLGPSHSLCNLRAGAVKGNRGRAPTQVFTSRPRIV